MRYAIILAIVFISTLNGADKKRTQKTVKNQTVKNPVHAPFGNCPYKDDPRSRPKVPSEDVQAGLQMRADCYKQLHEVIPSDLLQAMLPEARKKAEEYNAALPVETKYAIYLSRSGGREIVIEKEVKLARAVDVAIKVEQMPKAGEGTTTASIDAIGLEEFLGNSAVSDDN